MKSCLLFAYFLLSGSLLFGQPDCSLGVDPSGAAGQPGLYSQYSTGFFADNFTTYFTTHPVLLTRIDNTLDFITNNWGLPVPPFLGTATDQNSYTSVHRGSIYIPVSGNYTFSLTSDDASYLFLDNAALASPALASSATINNGGYHSALTVTTTLYLTAGMHNIKIVYGENNTNNTLIFQYSSVDASITTQVVPSTVLCTSIQAALPLPTAPTGCALSDPAGNPPVQGLYAEYYAGYFADVQTYFSAAPGLVRIDRQLGFTTDDSWGNIVPPAAGTVLNPDLYSVRWRGNIYIATTGSYTFSLYSDDASYLWLDANAQVSPPVTANATINNGGLHIPTTVSTTLNLTAGFHPLLIHFGENTGNNRLSLSYSCTSCGIATQIVPATVFCSGFSAAPLPIELLSVDVKSIGKNNAEIAWATATEQNNDYFTIERSPDALNFSALKNIPGAGNSDHTINYKTNDPDALNGISYYRLKQTDYNGNYSYSGIVSLNNIVPENKFVAYPNPSNGEVTFETTIGEPGSTVEYIVYNTMGQKVTSGSSTQSELKTIDLPPGIYSVVIADLNGKPSVSKIIVE